MSNSPFSDSGAGKSVVSDMPLPPPEPFIECFLQWAFELKIQSNEEFIREISLKYILDAFEQEPRELARIYARTLMMDKMFAEKFVAGFRRNDGAFDRERYEQDLAMALKVDPGAAKRLCDALGPSFFVRHVPAKQIFHVLMRNGWSVKDGPEHHELAGRLAQLLLDRHAFGTESDTLKHIYRAISLKELFGDHVPAALRVRMVEAVDLGCKTYDKKRFHEFIFEQKMGGVTLAELAEHLPPMIMVRPFEVFAEKHGMVETNIDKPSEMPSAGTVEQIEASAPKPPPPPIVPLPGFGVLDPDEDEEWIPGDAGD